VLGWRRGYVAAKHSLFERVQLPRGAGASPAGTWQRNTRYLRGFSCQLPARVAGQRDRRRGDGRGPTARGRSRARRAGASAAPGARGVPSYAGCRPAQTPRACDRSATDRLAATAENRRSDAMPMIGCATRGVTASASLTLRAALFWRSGSRSSAVTNTVLSSRSRSASTRGPHRVGGWPYRAPPICPCCSVFS